MRKICVAYWLLLTLLLWSRDPAGWFSDASVDALHDRLEPMAHFLSFGLLTLIVLSTPWRLSCGWLLVILAGYSAATELVQSQIPGRSMQLVDLLQDFAGLLVGAALFAVWQRIRGPRQELAARAVTDSLQRPRRRSESPVTTEPVVDSIPS
jgi:VanZ family protein